MLRKMKDEIVSKFEKNFRIKYKTSWVRESQNAAQEYTTNEYYSTWDCLQNNVTESNSNGNNEDIIKK